MNVRPVNLDRVQPFLQDAGQRLRRAVIAGAQRIEADAPTMALTQDVTVEGAEGPLAARLYQPARARSPGPAIVFFHGGGFVVGDLDTHDMLCRRLADAAEMSVVAVAYRLAPDHKFPAAPEDCYAAAQWLAEHGAGLGIDGRRLAVAGDSAGGNLAAVTAHLARERGGPTFFAQALFYPCTQLVEMRLPQLKMFRGDALAQSAQNWFRNAYLSTPEDAHDIRCSPLLAAAFERLPPTYVLTAGVDPLRDEGQAYARALTKASVPVVARDYANMVHGFLNLTAISSTARAAIADAGRWLQRAAERSSGGDLL